MSRRFDFEIDGERYHGDTASAKDQSKALRIAFQTNLITLASGKIGAVESVSVYNHAPESEADNLVRLLVKGKVYRSSDNVGVGENLFGDNIHNWSLLVAEVLKENIGPFWNLIDQGTTSVDQEAMS